MFEKYYERFGFQRPQIVQIPDPNLGIVVVIPAYNEDSLIDSVKSLNETELPNCSVEVIVVFNASETDEEQIKQKNKRAQEELENWFKTLDNQNFDLYCLSCPCLPKKHAGVGLARKIGMDEAAARLSSINCFNGVILCFDADSLCQKNYLLEVYHFFKKNETTAACSIHFEHPLSGEDFNQEVYDGIRYYELHLRYYKLGLAYADLPFAYHSIGSSMAVRALDYMKQGGMNRRKAGEDFYFLQKFIDIGSFGEIKTTTVLPSPRMSDRVPFGTGRAIKEMIENEREIEKSYSFQVFQELKNSFDLVESWYFQVIEPHRKLIEFVGEEDFMLKVEEIRNNSSSQEVFKKRFFQWFNAFKTLKFVHFLRDNYYHNQDLVKVVPSLLESMGEQHKEGDSHELLLQLRGIDLR